MNKEIFVPLLPWLVGGSRIGGSYNIYCASLGTDPLTGCIGKKIFNYRIWIEMLDETEYLKACCFFGTESYENCSGEIFTETFPFEEKSREAVKSWLEEKAEEFFA